MYCCCNKKKYSDIDISAASVPGTTADQPDVTIQPTRTETVSLPDQTNHLPLQCNFLGIKIYHEIKDIKTHIK